MHLLLAILMNLRFDIKKYNYGSSYLEIRQLRSFCAVAALRSISKASVEMGIAQPTVSVHVGELELVELRSDDW